MKTFRATFMGVLAAVLLTTGCHRLNADLRERSAGIPQQLQETSNLVQRSRDAFQAFTGSAEYASFKVYVEREKWQDDFTAADAAVAQAKAAYDEVLPLIDENHDKHTDAITLALDRISVLTRDARELAAKPGQRRELLQRTMEQAPELVRTAESQAALLVSKYRALESVVNGARETYPNKKDDLAQRLAPITTMVAGITMAAASANEQFKAEVPDYAIIADTTTEVAGAQGIFDTEDGKLRSKVNELGRSYRKTLVDMREDLFVQIGRTSWDGDADWPSEHEYEYGPVLVNEDAYTYFETFPEDSPLLTESSSIYESDSMTVDQARWDALKLDKKASWPSWMDDSAEYWIYDLPVKCFHKYIVEENGERTEQDWEEVSEETFVAQENNLGMDIIAKPHGVYEDEVLKEAAPAGMAYVGDPKYGQWRTDQNGRSFWEFYGQWMFLNAMLGDNNRYYRDEWSTWNTGYRGRKPYYGPTEDDERYGSGSTYAQTRYAGSHYGRNGGFRGQDPSVRGAGPSRRGGGPSGGGK